MKVELERAQALKEKFRMTVIKLQKECDELRDVNVATAEALEQETKRAKKKNGPKTSFEGRQQRA